jgi:thioredoxin-like negative regulator of GroEL
MSYMMKSLGSGVKGLNMSRENSFVDDPRKGFEIWDEMEDFEELKSCTNPIFVQFATLDCAESKKLEKKLGQMVEKYSDRIQFVFIDSDRFSHLCESEDISELPCIRIYESNKILEEMHGGNQGQLLKMLNKYIS